MKHNRTTINIAFAQSDEEGKKELLRHWAELKEIINHLKNRDRGFTIIKLREILDVK